MNLFRGERPKCRDCGKTGWLESQIEGCVKCLDPICRSCAEHFAQSEAMCPPCLVVLQMETGNLDLTGADACLEVYKVIVGAAVKNIFGDGDVKVTGMSNEGIYKRLANVFREDSSAEKAGV